MADGDRRRTGWEIGDRGEMVLSLTCRQAIVRCLPVGLVPLAMALSSSGEVLLDGRWGAAAIRMLIGPGVFAIFGPIIYLAARQHRSVVTAEGIVSTGGWGMKGAWWAEVLAVEERSVLGRQSVLLVTRHRTFELAAPRSGRLWFVGDPDFDAKVATIRAWQQACTPAAVPPMVYPAPVSG